MFRGIRQGHFDEHVGTGFDGIALGGGLGCKILHSDGSIQKAALLLRFLPKPTPCRSRRARKLNSVRRIRTG